MTMDLLIDHRSGDEGRLRSGDEVDGDGRIQIIKMWRCVCGAPEDLVQS